MDKETQDIDMEKLPYTRKVIESIEEEFTQLGLPTYFSLLSNLTPEVGLFLIAPKGSGKSTIIQAIQNLYKRMNGELMSDDKTYYGDDNELHITLDKKTLNYFKAEEVTSAGIVREDRSPMFSNNYVRVLIDDLTTIFKSDYFQGEAMTILTELMFHHHYSPKKYRSNYRAIQNCRVSLLGGGTPQILQNLTKNQKWENQESDRFLRFFPFYYGNEKFIELNTQPSFKVPHIPVPQSWNETEIKKKVLQSTEKRYFSGIGKNYTPEKFRTLVRMFQSQLSPSRAINLLRKLLKTNAFLNKRENIVQEDLELLELYKPNITIEEKLSWVFEQGGTRGGLAVSPNIFWEVFLRVIFWIGTLDNSFNTKEGIQEDILKLNLRGFRGEILEKAVDHLEAYISSNSERYTLEEESRFRELLVQQKKFLERL